MEWNTEVLFIERKTPAEIIQAFPDIYAAVSLERRFESVVSAGLAPHMATAKIGAWGVLFAPGTHLTERGNLLERLSRGSRALTVSLSATTNSFGFAWYEQGKLARRVHCADGDVDVHEGEPLPEEEGIMDVSANGWCGEAGLLLLVQRLTGISVEELEEASYGLVVMG